MQTSVAKAVRRRDFWVVLLLHALLLIQRNHGLLMIGTDDPCTRLGRDCSRLYMYGPNYENTTASASLSHLNFRILEKSATYFFPMAETVKSQTKDTTTVPQNKRGSGNPIRSSHLRAIQHVSGIIDLFVEESEGVHGSVVSSSVEGLIRKVYQDDYIDRDILRHLDALVGQCIECQFMPKPLSMRTLWFLHIRHFQCMPANNCPNEDVEAATRLLLFWQNFSQANNFLPPPPAECFHDILMLVRDRNATMTTTLWDLYLSHRDCAPERRFFETILDVLSSSREAVWQTRQCTVLQDMFRRQSFHTDLPLCPTVKELESALWAASRHGNAQQATWLCRRLTENTAPSSWDETHATTYTKAWFLSICNCKSEGSSLYLERLLEQIRYEDPSNPMNSREYYNLALRKFSLARKTGSGSRAEKIFKRMVAMLEETNDKKWLPDEESVHFVCLAYLNEEPMNPWNVNDVRRIMKSQGPRSHTISQALNAQQRSFYPTGVDVAS